MILTTDEAKAYLGLTGGEYDSAIEAFLPAVEEYVKRYCNHDFTEGGVESYPAPVKMTAAKMTWLQIRNMGDVRSLGVSAESIGDHSATYGGEEYPPDVMRVLKMYRRLRIL